jgi:hypothetical protein
VTDEVTGSRVLTGSLLADKGNVRELQSNLP